MATTRTRTDTRDSDSDTRSPEAGRTPLRRRAILAAAALVAGLAVERSAAPVCAASDANFTATGGNGTAFYVAPGGYTYGVSASGSSNGVWGDSTSGTGVRGTSISYYGVRGTSTTSTGVYGTSGSGYGAVGTSNSSYGVYGYSNSSYGVYGGSGSGYGAVGASSSGYGVYGISTSSYGVYGYSSGDHAIYGYLGTTTAGKAGVFGFGRGTGTYGVRGDGSTGGIGVYGSAAGGYGVVGRADVGDAAALYGSSSTPNVPAFYAVNYAAPSPPNSNAGFFIGQVYINGPFIVAGGPKSAAVPHPDGTHRLLYCVESPEAWFEDFGTGTISGGKAEVKLDLDFAAVVDTRELHVFLTPHGDEHHLNLAGRSATGFTVGAVPSTTSAVAGKKASDLSGTFTWRVVAKRKDVAAPRLAKFALPKAPPPPPTPVAEKKLTGSGPLPAPVPGDKPKA